MDKEKRTFRQFIKDHKEGLVRVGLVTLGILGGGALMLLLGNKNDKDNPDTNVGMIPEETAPADNIINLDDVASM